MEISLSKDKKRLETALKESKETSLTDNVVKAGDNSTSESNPVVHRQVCRICGKVLQHPSEAPSEEQRKVNDSCSNCATIGENTITEAVNRRDSGFHTMNRQSADSQLELVVTMPDIISDNEVMVTDGNYCNTNTQIPIQHNCGRTHYQNDSANKNSARETVSPKAFAENLFNCNGYKRTEVARILGKK